MNDQPHTYQQVKAMIKQFTGQANTLTIPRVFVEFTGDHLAALLLSQVLFWSDKTDDPDGWFYKTADDWSAELGMSTYQIKRAATVLEKLGIETRLRKVKGAPRMHYRVDYTCFIDLFFKFLENQQTSKSTNYKMENQETSKTMDFEETAKTYKEQKTTSEDHHHRGDGDGRKKKHRTSLSDWLTLEGMGAAEEFADLDEDAAKADFTRRRRAGDSCAQIVKAWRIKPPVRKVPEQNGVAPLAGNSPEETARKLREMTRK